MPPSSGTPCFYTRKFSGDEFFDYTGSLTINLGLGQTYTFDDTAGLNALPGRARFYRVRLVA
jgi:hypothetical protein